MEPIIHKDRICIADATLVPPVGVAIQDADSGEWYTGSAWGAVIVWLPMAADIVDIVAHFEYQNPRWIMRSGLKRIFIQDDNNLQAFSVVQIQDGRSSDPGTIAETIRQLANQSVGRHYVADLDSLLEETFDRIIGITPLGTGTDPWPVVFTPDTAYQLALNKNTGDISNPTSESLGAKDIRPGWTFSAWAVSQKTRLRTADAVYVVGTTTDGATTENALYIMSDLGSPGTFESGDWGVETGQWMARPVYNNDTGEVLVLSNAAGTQVIKLARFNGSTGAHINTTTIIASGAESLEAAAATDGTHIFFAATNTADGNKKYVFKHLISDGSLVSATSLDDAITEHGSGYCTMVFCTGGKVYVSTDSANSGTVMCVFDTDSMQLLSSYPLGSGKQADTCAGTTESTKYVYSYSGRRTLTVIDKDFGTAVKTILLPSDAPWTYVLDDSGKIPQIVIAGDGEFACILTRDVVTNIPYLTFMMVDVLGKDAENKLARPGDEMNLAAVYDAAKTAAQEATVQEALVTLNATYGSGDTAVNHNTGPDGAALADNLRFVDGAANPIDNAEIKIYLKTDWDAGNVADVHIKARSRTKADGRWQWPVQIDAGFVYIVVFYKQGAFSPATAEIDLT